MSAEMSLEVVRLTQENLGKFIKKPPLTEKLLKKPPFRFLHDIVTTVSNSHLKKLVTIKYLGRSYVLKKILQ